MAEYVQVSLLETLTGDAGDARTGLRPARICVGSQPVDASPRVTRIDPDHWRYGVEEHVARAVASKNLRAELAECRRLGLIQRQRRRLELLAARTRDSGTQGAGEPNRKESSK